MILLASASKRGLPRRDHNRGSTAILAVGPAGILPDDVTAATS